MTGRLADSLRELRLQLVTRLALAGTAISVLAGGLFYFIETRRVEEAAFERAEASARHFDSPDMRSLVARRRLGEHPELGRFLASTGFVGIRILDLDGKRLWSTTDMRHPT